MPSISQDEKHFLGMAGEFLVAAELNRRHIVSAVTYGTAKSADVWAFNEGTHRAVRIEVKTTSIENRKWAIGIKALLREGWNPDIFWVLVLLPPPHPTTAQTNDERRGQHSPRFFVLSSKEVAAPVCSRHDLYRAKYMERNNKEFDDKGGFYKLFLEEALPFENAWGKVEARLRESGKLP
jgi:hypothetical protein